MIPKTIHRVWLGDGIPLDRDVGFTDKWQKLHPNWSLMVWDDQAVEDHLRPMVTGDLYDRLPTYVHRADLVCIEAINRYGGLCAGWDVEPTQSWEPLIGDSDGWTTIDVDGFPGGIFGARPGHPALGALLETIVAGVTLRGGFSTPNVDTGPLAWGEALGPKGRMPGGLELVGTAKSWAPVHWKQKHLLNDPELVAALRADPEVYSIHYFNHSWKNLDDVKVR